jgi:hypothetical protein
MILSVKWRVLIWAALVIGAVAVVGLGVDIVVAGPDKAAVLAGIVVGFCEVVGAGFAVVSWAGERKSTQPAVPKAPDAPGSQPTAGSGKYVVDARDATGVQVGDGNTQHVDTRPDHS